MKRPSLQRGVVLLAALAVVLSATWLLADYTPGPRLSRGESTPASILNTDGTADDQRPLLSCQTVSAWPEKPEKTVLYVGVPAGETRSVAVMLLCPCGCGDPLTANLRPERDPHWTLEFDGQGHPTLQPSYWRNGHCESHFTLVSGRIYMIPAQPPQVD